MPPAPAKPPAIRHIEDLRRWRNKPAKDLSLAYLAQHVQKTFVKPHRELGDLHATWERLVPEPLRKRAAMAGISRGVLTIHAADHSALYDLERLLRSGVERQLRAASKTAIRKVRTLVAK